MWSSKPIPRPYWNKPTWKLPTQKGNSICLCSNPNQNIYWCERYFDGDKFITRENETVMYWTLQNFEPDTTKPQTHSLGGE